MRLPLLSALVAGLLLAGVAMAHPSVRFVDIINFSSRAQSLGDRLTDPLYPIGYPALLAALHALGGSVLAGAKALSVLAGTGLVFAASFLASPASALWMIAQPAALEWGSTEGTDMPAAALSIGAIAAANARRSNLAGAFLGLACLLRYTAVAAVPVVLVLDRAAWRSLLVVMSPHLLLAGWTGTSPFPDQSLSLGIGAGHQTRLLSLDTLLRWPMGFVRALEYTLPDWPSRAAALGLLLGVRNRAARGLLAFALLHLALLAVAFSNARLCLPASLAFSLGACWLLPARLPFLPGLGAVGSLLLHRTELVTERPEAVERALLASKCDHIDRSVVSNSPWFYAQHDGWLIGGRPLVELGSPRDFRPTNLADRLRGANATTLALDFARIPNSAPGLVPLMKTTPPGLVEVARTPGWGVWRLDED